MKIRTKKCSYEKVMAKKRPKHRNPWKPLFLLQILVRILMRACVIYISDMPDETVAAMHMIPAHSIGEAMEKAKEILGKENPTVTAIPEGISVVVRK